MCILELTDTASLSEEEAPELTSWGFSGLAASSGLAPATLFLQRSNPSFFCLLHWQTGSLPLAPPGKPTLEWLDLKLSQEVLGLFSLPFKSVYFNET